jgi:glutaredoxin 3
VFLVMADQKEVLVYGAEWCGFCHQVMKYFDGFKIPYKYINLDEEPARAEEAVTKSGQMGIPVTDIDGTIIVGFDRPKIDAALKEKGLMK